MPVSESSSYEYSILSNLLVLVSSSPVRLKANKFLHIRATLLLIYPLAHAATTVGPLFGRLRSSVADDTYITA